jgi:hypothetical protein
LGVCSSAPAADTPDFHITEVPPVAAPARAPGKVVLRDGYSGLGIGLRLAWFHYNEILPIDELLDLLGASAIEGTPKSTEYGALEGLEFEYTARMKNPVMFVRSRLGVYLGLLNHYDGSTQAQAPTTPGDSVWTVDPVEVTKNNYFFKGALEIGAGRFDETFSVTGFTGIDARLWSRTFPGPMVEYYYWVNLPVGVGVSFSPPGGWQVGIDARLYFMLAGEMQYRREEPGPRGIVYATAPAVELSYNAAFGERISYRVDIPITKRVGSTVSLRLCPVFEYYHFGKSNYARMIEYDEYGNAVQTASFVEPASDTYWWTLNFDVLVHLSMRHRARR